MSLSPNGKGNSPQEKSILKNTDYSWTRVQMVHTHTCFGHRVKESTILWMNLRENKMGFFVSPLLQMQQVMKDTCLWACHFLSLPPHFPFALDFHHISGYISSKHSDMGEVPLKTLSVEREVGFFIQVGWHHLKVRSPVRKEMPPLQEQNCEGVLAKLTSDGEQTGLLSAEHH